MSGLSAIFLAYTRSVCAAYFCGAALGCALSVKVTAICVSIDRFLQDTAPNLCLPFDGTGARHPGMTPTPEADSLHATHPSYRVAHGNQQHTPGTAK